MYNLNERCVKEICRARSCYRLVLYDRYIIVTTANMKMKIFPRMRMVISFVRNAVMSLSHQRLSRRSQHLMTEMAPLSTLADNVEKKTTIWSPMKMVIWYVKNVGMSSPKRPEK